MGQRLPSLPPPTPTPLPVLLVLSHVRWNFALTRPQQLLSRLARRWRVVYVEEPVRAGDGASLEISAGADGVEVLTPHTEIAEPDFGEAQCAHLERILSAHLQRERIASPVVWVTTPMALPLAQALGDALGSSAVVYDCMEDLAALAAVPSALPRLEAQLLTQAALVLTAGPQLQASRSEHNANVYCVPNSVDAWRFAPAGLDSQDQDARAVQRSQGHLPRPRLGCFGVFDERIDFALLARLAQAHPDWQLVMVGPLAGLGESDLPRAPNLHWLGPRPYRELPHFLAGWDLALLPYVQAPSTHGLNPVQTLEYMAGIKPVLSTALDDVIGLYGHTVEVAASDSDFIGACERLLHESAHARRHRLHATMTTVATHSWDHTANVVHQLLLDALERQRRAQKRRPDAFALSAALSVPLPQGGRGTDSPLNR